MKKNTLIISWSTILLLTSCGTEVENTNTPVTTNTTATSENRDIEITNMQPDYKNELYWKVKSVEGNIFTISEIDTSKDPTIEMEQAEKQAYMKALSEADRMALKETILSAVIWDVKVMIPVWIPMIKKELVWEEKQDLEATLSDIKTWDIISVWYNQEVTDRKVAKYVKRSIRK